MYRKLSSVNPNLKNKKGVVSMELNVYCENMYVGGEFLKKISKPPKKLSLCELEKFVNEYQSGDIKFNDREVRFPKGCCVCSIEDGRVVIGRGNADQKEFDQLVGYMVNFKDGKEVTSEEDVKKLCSGTYIMIGDEDFTIKRKVRRW
jgi:hypothetical protein